MNPEEPPLAARPVVPNLMLWLGVWGTLAPYLAKLAGYEVDVAPVVEVVDHVVPGLVILVVAGVFLRSGTRPLLPALAAVLSAFWMFSTHVPLVRDAINRFQSPAAAALHTLPAVLLLILALILAVQAYREAPA